MVGGWEGETYKSGEELVVVPCHRGVVEEGSGVGIAGCGEEEVEGAFVVVGRV